MSPIDDQLWSGLHAADTALNDARMAFVQGAVDMTATIASALHRPSERGTALRLLLLLPEGQSRKHVSELVSLASVGHADIGLTRSVVGRIDHAWLVENIGGHVDQVLEVGAGEEYRRIAELFAKIDAGLLETHLGRCEKHQDGEVREVAIDFKLK